MSISSEKLRKVLHPIQIDTTHFGGSLLQLVMFPVPALAYLLEMRAVEEQVKEACIIFREVLDSAAQFGGEEVLEF